MGFPRRWSATSSNGSDNGLDKDRRFNHVEWKAMSGLMKAMAQGARGLMRVYTRACCDKARGPRDMRGSWN